MRPAIAIIESVLAIPRQELYGVEVGVAEGINAESILGIFAVKKLVLVDNYSTVEDECLAKATKRLSRYYDRTEWLLKDSVEAAKQFRDNTFDFIYIDADHKYNSVMADLEAWYPKMKTQSVFCGHDIWNSDVYKAVMDFADKKPHNLYGNVCLISKTETISFQLADFMDWWMFT